MYEREIEKMIEAAKKAQKLILEVYNTDFETRIFFAMAEEAIEKQIEEVLDKVRPFLKREGGDIEYIGFLDGVVYVRMVGACNGCLYADADISQGVEIILMEEVPGVIRCDASMNLPEEVMNEYLARKEKELTKEK